jgi:hypothetical protein
LQRLSTYDHKITEKCPLSPSRQRIGEPPGRAAQQPHQGDERQHRADEAGRQEEIGDPAARRIHHEQCSADVINAFTQLDVAGMWGDGQVVAVDGSQLDTWENNLLASPTSGMGATAGWP